ncbi:hypothetical protein SAMN05421823_102554 [Catalinimonas alkaloidigena]|uniref:Uncharacterized protein n=1 Tax=Catalinimonas alkaloidigena TaxID=1075417 RepID=A0A1G9B944_9BACT|nr:hypothetical protein [Catalinimonas alkaloidigena]SDK36086.1 hypothetical protein SAMN05421823_102554 [Catalinimonas alkaloidigena]
MSEAEAEIERNRDTVFGTEVHGYYAIKPFQVTPENRHAIWGDADLEDFEIRLYPEEVRWYTLRGQEFAHGSPVDLVDYCNDLLVVVTQRIPANSLNTIQIAEFIQVLYRLVETKMWAGQLYLAANQKIEAEKGVSPR